MEKLLKELPSLSLEELSEVALLNRRDTKFILSEKSLPKLIESLAKRYRVLDIDNCREFRYHTVYYDTDDLNCYHQHHNGRNARFKVRSRKYLDTSIQFDEVKCRATSGDTVKHRLSREAPFRSGIESPFATLITSKTLLQPERLKHSVEVFYSRTTFASPELGRRITIDSDLRAQSDTGEIAFPGLIIAELKTPPGQEMYSAIREMRMPGIRRTGCSKYCLSVALLNQNIRRNMFKPKIRRIESVTGSRLTKGVSYDIY